MRFVIILSFLLSATTQLICQNATYCSNTIHDYRLDSTRSFLKDYATGEMMVWSKYLYSFDEDENIQSLTTYLWYEEEWFHSSSRTYSYDENRSIIRDRYQIYDKSYGGNLDEEIDKEFTYNAIGNITTQTRYWFYRYHGKLFERWDKTINEYDSSGELVLCSTNYSKEEEKDELLLTNKVEYLYDTNGKVIQETHSDWDIGSNSWVFDKQYKYTYDNSSNRLSEIWSYWDEDSNEWHNSFMKESEYNSSGVLIALTESRWIVDQGWQYWYKSEYTFDDNGNLTLLLFSVWDVEFCDWENEYKKEYTFDVNGNLILYLYCRWAFGSTWLNEDKEEFTYDSNGFIASRIEYSWGLYGGPDQWVPEHKNLYTFDQIGNLLEYEEYTVDLPDLDWVKFGKLEYEYDLEIFVDDVLCMGNAFENTSIYNHKFVNAPIKYKQYTDDNGDWEFRSEKSYYCTGPFSYIPEITEKSIEIFPNPASEYIEFELLNTTDIKSVKLYDLNGKEVLRHNRPKARVDIRDLSSGIYLYMVNIGDDVYHGKIVVE